jgi:flagellin-like hook-associated protein FlgL
MAINDVSLSKSMRSNLLSLQNTSNLMSRTQDRLSTGKRINSAIDGPTAYFAAQALNSRAGILDGLKDGMGQAVSTIEAANKGITAIASLIEQAKGIASQIQSTTGTEETQLGTQYTTVLSQLDKLATDAGYQGKNLVNGGTITVKFEGSNSLTVTGFTATAGALAITAAVTSATGAAAVTSLDTALVTLRTESSKLSASLSIITARQDFTTEIGNTLMAGADKLTLADTNEEGANMLALQTRQSLSISSLSLASQANQAVLKLFG